MQTFDQHLIKLVKEGLIAPEVAKQNANSPADLDLVLKGFNIQGSSGDPITETDGNFEEDFEIE